MHQKRYPGRVVHVDFELDPGEVQPVLREVERRLHELRSDAFSLPIFAHSHADAADVAYPRACWGGDQGQFSDYFVACAGDQLVEAFRRVLETLLPKSQSRERELQGADHDGAGPEEPVQGLRVGGFRVPNRYVHGWSPIVG